MGVARENKQATLVTTQAVAAGNTWESALQEPALGEVRRLCQLLVTATYAADPSGSNEQIVVGYHGNDGTNDFEDTPPQVPRTVDDATTFRFPVMMGDVASDHKWFVENDTDVELTLTVVLTYAEEVVS